jgi:hypothetical protein
VISRRWNWTASIGTAPGLERALRDEVSLLQWSTRVLSAEILDGVFATDSGTGAPHCAAPPRARSVVSASSTGNHRVVLR